jgi:hypothetical protein
MAGYNIDIREVEWLAHRVYRFPNVMNQVFMEGYLSMPVRTQHNRKRLPISMPAQHSIDPTHTASSSPKSRRIKHKLFHGLFAPIRGYTSASQEQCYPRVVDATQSLGRIPVNVEDVAFLMASSYRWLMFSAVNFPSPRRFLKAR